MRAIEISLLILVDPFISPKQGHKTKKWFGEDLANQQLVIWSSGAAGHSSSPGFGGIEDLENVDSSTRPKSDQSWPAAVTTRQRPVTMTKLAIYMQNMATCFFFTPWTQEQKAKPVLSWITQHRVSNQGVMSRTCVYVRTTNTHLETSLGSKESGHACQTGGLVMMPFQGLGGISNQQPGRQKMTRQLCHPTLEMMQLVWMLLLLILFQDLVMQSL